MLTRRAGSCGDRLSRHWSPTLKSRIAVHNLLMAAAGVLVASSLSGAQTVGDAAKLPEDQQREIVMRFVNTSVPNLRSHTDTNGRPKSDDEYTRDRAVANLVRALFVQDPERPSDAPEGPRVMLARIKKYSTATPDRTVLDVMGELVDWSFQHFYTEVFTTPEKKADYAAKSDADQELQFRLRIQMYENERAYQRTIKKLNERDEELRQRIQEMYDNAIILADGRHVLRTNEGDFMVISADPDTSNDVKLEDRFVPEAQALYDCMNARSLKNGKEARAVCASR